MLAAALAGLGLGAVTGVGPLAEPLVLPALMALLVGVFVQVTPQRVRDATRRLRVVTASVALNFAWTPLLAWGLGAVLLAGHPDLRLGLLMLLVTPCTDWYLVFTGLARGNLGLATALLPLNLGLQLVLLPVFVLVLGGVLVPVDPATLLEAIAVVVVIPAAVAAGVRLVAVRARGPGWLDRVVAPRVGPVSAGLLCLAVAAMFAAHGQVLLDRPEAVVRLLPALAAFFAVAYLVAQLVAGRLRLDYPERVTLTMTTVARNSPLALAIAVAAFPSEPLIALALVAAPLIELPVLAVVVQLLRRGSGSQSWSGLWQKAAAAPRGRRHPRHARGGDEPGSGATRS